MSKYDPAAWAEMIKDCGAKYAVITTKHHDGVAMYDTKLGKLSSVKTCPAKKDMIKPLFEELRKRDVKCGAYFSLIDWTHNDYPDFLKDKKRYDIKKEPAVGNVFRNFFKDKSKKSLTGTILICGGLMATGNTVPKNGRPKKHVK